jgi:hypothetical protein
MVKFATIDINIFFYVIKMSKIAYLITYISYSYVYNDRGTIEETLLHLWTFKTPTSKFLFS